MIDWQRLRELYAQVPSIECKGLCWNSCGPIDMSDLEREAIHQRGFEIPRFTHEAHVSWSSGSREHLCPALDPVGRCSVYAQRPLICRLWGVTESMPCPHGCKMTEPRLDDATSMGMIAESMGVSPEDVQTFRDHITDPLIGPIFKRFMQGEEVTRELEAAMRARTRHP